MALFRGKKIRKTIHNDKWWFPIDWIEKRMRGIAPSY